jgi:hypothetical protein
MARMLTLLCLLLFLFGKPSHAQLDSVFLKQLKALDTSNILKTDTLAVPDDRITAKIRELRQERGGLTIPSILQMNLAEAQKKDTVHSSNYYQDMVYDITNGNTARLLNNCVVNLYRQSFTEAEIDDLVRFYKTSAGKKMNTVFILLLVRSLKDAEQLMKLAAKRMPTK